jgi:hypothetical protein
MKSKSQSGVALVVTLLMLSIITFLTVAFLALSKRNRESVAVTKDQRVARGMANSALARAQTEIISRMMRTNGAGRHELLSYDYMVSKNFIRRGGFVKNQGLNYENVNYDYFENGSLYTPKDEAEWVQNIANLRYDPRPPVFIANDPLRPSVREFRYWYDVNRNGLFEDSGIVTNFTAASNGRVLANGWRWYEGDPQWIGALKWPDAGHSPTNQFIGRYAFFVQPVGKMLDLNFAHNHLSRTNNLDPSGWDHYVRGSGAGSWEMNLAGALVALNTNAYRTNSTGTDYGYLYRGSNAYNEGRAFTAARSLLVSRYPSKMNAGDYIYYRTNNAANYYNGQDLLDSTTGSLGVFNQAAESTNTPNLLAT